MIFDNRGGGNLRVLAVVPARAGSKGVARKNIAEINGLSMIARAGRVVSLCEWIDGAVLSTDDEDFAAEGHAAGLEVPSLRPHDLANDTATGIAVWAHAWLMAEQAHKCHYDIAVYLQPTSPFRTPKQVHDTVALMLSGGHQAATTISPVPGHYNPQKTLMMADDGTLSFYDKDGALHSNRQTAVKCWTRNGLVYAARRAQIIERGVICESECGGLVVEGYVANIDDPEDLLIARLLAEHADYDVDYDGYDKEQS